MRGIPHSFDLANEVDLLVLLKKKKANTKSRTKRYHAKLNKGVGFIFWALNKNPNGFFYEDKKNTRKPVAKPIKNFKKRSVNWFALAQTH